MPIIKEKYQLKTSDILTFQTPNNGYYLIKVKARAKNEKQRNATDDEEITVKIDDIEFPKQNTSKGVINSLASFNGGKLHNKEQIIYCVIYLKIGNHTIELTPQYGDGAEILEISFEEMTMKNNQVILNLNQQSEDRDKQPWITFVFINIGIKSQQNLEKIG